MLPDIVRCLETQMSTLSNAGSDASQNSSSARESPLPPPIPLASQGHLCLLRDTNLPGAPPLKLLCRLLRAG